MELSGSLKQFPVSKVLQFLNMDEATGLLTLKQGKRRIVLTLQNGNILDVEDSENPREERIKALLVRSNRILDDEWPDLQEEKRTRLVPIGSILIDRGIITADEQVRLAKLIYLNILADAFAMTEGSYEFERKENVTPGELGDPIAAAGIMLNAARQEDEWPSIRRVVPNSSAVFNRSPGVEDEVWNAHLDRLAHDEKRIVRALDGFSTVHDIADGLFVQEFEVSRIMAELVRRGLAARQHEHEEQLAGARPQTFFSLQLGMAALVPIVFALLLITGGFVWKYYLHPLVSDAGISAAPLNHGGRSVDTVNAMRLHRLQTAFYVYLQGQGRAPTSLDVLVEGGYCNPADLRVIGGGSFSMKLVGQQENLAMIEALDPEGKSIEHLRIDMTVR